MKTSRIALAVSFLTIWLTSCQTVDDDRIPLMPVNINLSDIGVWHTYGVSGFGMHRDFIRDTGSPSGFPYTERTATGYGGVLLIEGMDAYTTQTSVPLAYDLSCPVERKPEIRVRINNENYEAVCPVCGSTYDVTMAGGSPLTGPAAQYKYGLRRYRVVPYGQAYIITN